jgi:hypothetical protein
MTNQDFDRLLESVRRNVPDSAAAAARVRQRLQRADGGACAIFRADFAALRAGALSEARRMLVEDHLVCCGACRRAYAGERATVLEMPRRSGQGWVWRGLAVAAVLAMAVVLPAALERSLAPEGARAVVASLEGSLVAVRADGTAALAVGAEIGEAQWVRTGPDSRAVLRMRDGSLLEMAERSTLALHQGWRNKMVRLERGQVIIEAAPQHGGRLEVATADARVSVKGTIFSVAAAFGGSRVSVIEGVVQVQPLGGAAVTLRRGAQTATGGSAPTAVAEEIAWSRNAARYAALLADLESVREQIARIPMPGLRYASRLLDRVPVSSVAVAAMPNLGHVLDEANRIFENKARESAVLAEWWNASGALQMRAVLDRARAMSAFLGEEIVVALPRHGPPLMLAELRPEVGREQFGAELARGGFPGPVAYEGNLVALGAAAVPPPSGFAATPLGARMLERYRAGAGLLFAMNAGEVRAGAPVGAAVTGFDRVRFVVAEQKGSLAAPEHTAVLTFDGPRRGLASWLAAPAPMGSLEFVSAEATFAAAFVTRNPREMLEDLLAAKFLPQDLARAELLAEIAGSLGGEVTIAFDGGLLPTPAWEIAVEVQDTGRLRAALGRLLGTEETVDGRTFYAWTGGAKPVQSTFADGYWLLAPDRALLLRAIANRAAGLTLPRSAAFRAQLPSDGPGFFSGLLYYNPGAMLGPAIDQLKAAGMLPQQSQHIELLTANRAPGLVYIYGEPDAIRAGSKSALFPLAMQALVSGNLMAGLPVGFPKGPQ